MQAVQTKCSWQSSEQRVTVEQFRRWLTSLTASDEMLERNDNTSQGPAFRLPGALQFVGCPSDCWGASNIAGPLRLPGPFRLLRSFQIAGPLRLLGPLGLLGPLRLVRPLRLLSEGLPECWGSIILLWALRLLKTLRISGSPSKLLGPLRLLEVPQIAEAPQISGSPLKIAGALQIAGAT